MCCFYEIRLYTCYPRHKASVALTFVQFIYLLPPIVLVVLSHPRARRLRFTADFHTYPVRSGVFRDLILCCPPCLFSMYQYECDCGAHCRAHAYCPAEHMIWLMSRSESTSSLTKISMHIQLKYSFNTLPAYGHIQAEPKHLCIARRQCGTRFVGKE